MACDCVKFAGLKSIFIKNIRIDTLNISNNMLEFLFGFILGVWAGQSVPLPSVGNYVDTFWTKKPEVIETADAETGPLFTGEMHPTVPT